MRPRIEKPFEPVMRFFTPELFVKFNSAQNEEADRTDDEWEAAIVAYRKHLDGLSDQLPPHVQKLAGLCLHDAELLACEERIEPFPLCLGFANLSVRQDDEVVSLIDFLWDRVRKHEAGDHWPFSKERTRWLYDEVDVSPDHRGMFIHRIFLSDGTIMEVPSTRH